MKYRFGERGWTPAQSAAIGNYLYHISALPASGEYSLRSILVPLIRLKNKPQPQPQAESIPEGELQANDTSASSSAPPQTIIRPFARVPLSPLLLSTGALPLPSTAPDDVKESVNSEVNMEKSQVTVPVPVLILYGDSDWISFPEVPRYTKRLRDLGVPAELVIIPEAGHHLYMDNTEAVHRSIHSWWHIHGRQ